ncbi:hypothetical protein KYG_04190 [Acidovorax sp. NO-1]|uniref:conjugal transfer protein TraD n=1 Tax=Acidovorax sp. NO-1 TaxID=512030 RepID=UPI00023FCA8D|nr:conjugal transfer protein TraD [Acidovorax sp. NO-1]EHL24148.1 hypothetical protein KYG_04190 [Acidovorax sp. NO-1]
MTVHTEQSTVHTDGTMPASLIRLRMRESALRQQAAQYQARAEHLERVARHQAQQLGRRIDAHEKIVLGALVKKAGMAMPAPHTDIAHDQHENDVESMSSRRGIAAQSAAYDRALILGSLMWLTSALNHPANDAVMVPDRQRLREDGERALRRSG